MELINPCIDRGDGTPCDLKDEDKRNKTCMQCNRRIEYVKAIGGLSEAVPDDINLDCGNGGTEFPEKVEKAKTEPEPIIMNIVNEICHKHNTGFNHIVDRKRRFEPNVREAIKEIISVLSGSHKMKDAAIAKILGVTNSAVWQQRIRMDEPKKDVKKVKKQKTQKTPPVNPAAIIYGELKKPLKEGGLGIKKKEIDTAPIYEKILVVDFTSHSKLYERLVEISADQMRSPEDQAKFIIKCYLAL